MSNFQSKCMYCGSTGYGSGCIFSAKGIHVHTDDPTRCIYCGMMAYGSGCIFNPYTQMHIHGADVGQTIKETVRKTVELSYLTDRLFENIKNTEAYKNKLINENGNLLRAPETPHEMRLVSPLSKFLQRIKKFFSADTQTVVESLKITSPLYKETVEEYRDKIQFEQEIKHIIKQLHIAIKTNSNKMSLESIESAIETAILDNIMCE